MAAKSSVTIRKTNDVFLISADRSSVPSIEGFGDPDMLGLVAFEFPFLPARCRSSAVFLPK